MKRSKKITFLHSLCSSQSGLPPEANRALAAAVKKSARLENWCNVFTTQMVAVFLNNPGKWKEHGLGEPFLLVVTMCEIVAQQYICFDVSTFYIATYHLAISLLLPLLQYAKSCRPPKAVGKGIAEKDGGRKDITASGHASLYTHSLTNHSTQQLLSTRTPLSKLTEHILDASFSELKKQDARISGHPRDLVNFTKNMYNCEVARSEVCTEKETERAFNKFDTLQPRLQIAVFSCFGDLTDHLTPQMLSTLRKQFSNDQFEGLIKDHQRIPGAWFICKESDTILNQDLHVYTADPKWLVFSKCKDGKCDKCTQITPTMETSQTTTTTTTTSTTTTTTTSSSSSQAARGK